MRALLPDVAEKQPAPKFCWTPLRVLVIACAYAAPLVLLCLRLSAEMQAGTLSLDGCQVLVRFIVVGVFAWLLSRWCRHWMCRKP